MANLLLVTYCFYWELKIDVNLYQIPSNTIRF